MLQIICIIPALLLRWAVRVSLSHWLNYSSLPPPLHRCYRTLCCYWGSSTHPLSPLWAIRTPRPPLRPPLHLPRPPAPCPPIFFPFLGVNWVPCHLRRPPQRQATQTRIIYICMCIAILVLIPFNNIQKVIMQKSTC